MPKTALSSIPVSLSLAQEVSPANILSLDEFFLGAIDFSKVRIKRRDYSWSEETQSGKAGKARRNIAYIDSDVDINTPFGMFVLSHELTHVWQNQHFGTLRTSVTFSWSALRNYLRNRHDDNRSRTDKRLDLYRFSLLPTKSLTRYGVEQQASIVSCIYMLLAFEDDSFMKSMCNDWLGLSEDQQDSAVARLHACLVTDLPAGNLLL